MTEPIEARVNAAEQEAAAAAERKAVYAAVKLLRACHALMGDMGELAGLDPNSQVLDLLTPLSEAAHQITATHGGSEGSVYAAMYQVGDLIDTVL